MNIHGSVPVDRWIDRHCKARITLDDLPKDMSPVTAERPTTYACLLSGISSWPLPPGLTKRLEAGELDGVQQRNITCLVSMSFYHALSKRFFGSTWIGHEHPFSIKSSTKELPVDNLNELVYYYSSICDPKECFLVIELVVATLNALDDSVTRRYSCGYALLHPFVTSTDPCPVAGRTHLFSGSPRELLELKGNGSAILKQLAKKTSVASAISYVLWRPALLGVASCLKENYIVGAAVPIPGLRRTTIDHLDDRGRVEEHCIGAGTRGTVREWTLSPPRDAPVAARPSVLELRRVGVRIPRRTEFERALASWAATAGPQSPLHLLDKVNFFAWNKAKKEDKGGGANGPVATVVRRRLRIGVHNGHAILHDQWYDADLHGAEGSDFDRLHAEDMGIARHYRACALFCVVEYTLDAVHATKGLRSPQKTSSRTVTATVGVTVLAPQDGLGDMDHVTLDLVTDPRCQALCAHPLYSPARDDSAEPPSLSFRLRVFDPRTSDAKREKIDAISMDSSIKTRFVQSKKTDGYSSGYETKEDCSMNSSRVDEDTSMLTFEGSARTGPSHTVTSPAAEAAAATVRDTRPVDHLSSKSSFSVSVEVGDDREHTAITITLHSFDHGPAKLPPSLQFRWKLYSYDEVTTDAFALNEDNGLATFADPSRFSFGYDYSSVDSAADLAHFLMEQDLFVDVFDEARLHLGTLTLPLHLFLRQGCSSKTLQNLAVPLRATGPVEGSIIMSIHCVGGKQGKDTNTKSQGVPGESHDAECVAVHRCVEHGEDDHSGKQDERQGHSPPGKEAPHKTPRRQQPPAVEEFRRERPKGDSASTEATGSFSSGDMSEQGQFEDVARQWEALQRAREGKKKQLIADHIKAFEEMSPKA